MTQLLVYGVLSNGIFFHHVDIIAIVVNKSMSAVAAAVVAPNFFLIFFPRNDSLTLGCFSSAEESTKRTQCTTMAV